MVVMFQWMGHLEREKGINMQKELKEKWVEALRSGSYNQCAGLLRSVDGFCCLGVLADVANPYGWDFDTDNEDDEKTLRYYHKFGDQSNGDGNIMLGEKWWVEVSGRDLDTMSELASLNDEGNPFTFIADVIEAKIPVTS